ncbi:MAG TPA: cupin domain-containing protein [Microbacteriaceae bacterium]|nr:cupin domain-containing protein [Microbacteriaceae bacterium]
MDGYEVLELGPLDEWLTRGKQFVDKQMDTDFIGLSVNAMAPGGQSPFWHRHLVLEEIYLFLEGQGRMALDDEVIDVGWGTAVRVGQGVWRHLHALTDSPSELRWVCIRAGGQPLAELRGDSEKDAERPTPW